MEYFDTRLDRKTGELVEASLGDWIPFTELGQHYGVSARKVRLVLKEMDFVYIPGNHAKAAYRLSDWAIEAGFGRRIERSRRVKYAFYVISPIGQQWVAERWAGALASVDGRSSGPELGLAGKALEDFQASRNRRLTVEEGVSWLLGHYPSLSQENMAAILSVSQPLVSYHVNTRRKQLRETSERRARPLDEAPPRTGPSVAELWYRWSGEVYNAAI
jgi:hypothetical protein